LAEGKTGRVMPAKYDQGVSDEESKDIQVKVPNEYLIGMLTHDDNGYLTADVIMYNKVVRLKLTQEQIDIAKNISLYNKK
jgi:hypothetical protein